MSAVKNAFHDEICGRAAFTEGELNPDALHDLYEALEDANQHFYGTLSENGSIHKRMRAALKKARGESL